MISAAERGQGPRQRRIDPGLRCHGPCIRGPAEPLHASQPRGLPVGEEPARPAVAVIPPSRRLGRCAEPVRNTALPNLKWCLKT